MMMKRLMIIGCMAASLFAACNNPVKQKKNVETTGKKPEIAKHFTCTMHPGVLADKPGLCPKCGMELVEKDN